MATKPDNKLRLWVRNAHPNEQEHVAKQAGIKRHYLQRLARGEVPDPGLYTCRRIVEAINEYTDVTQLNDRLPNITLDDI